MSVTYAPSRTISATAIDRTTAPRVTLDPKAALLATVLATSCNRCDNFQPGRGCRVGYDACKSGMPLGTALLFQRRK